MTAISRIMSRVSLAVKERRLLSGIRKTSVAFAYECFDRYGGARDSVRNSIALGREIFYRRALGSPSSKCASLPCISVSGDHSSRPESVSVKHAFDRAIAGIGG